MKYSPHVLGKKFFTISKTVTTAIGSVAIIAGFLFLPLAGWPFFVAMIAVWLMSIWCSMVASEALDEMERNARHSFFVGAYAAILAEHPAAYHEIKNVVPEEQFRHITVGAVTIRRNISRES